MTKDARPVFGEAGHERGASVNKLSTGIPGFDVITMGGRAERRTTVLVGQAGRAKTVFAGQFLDEGVRRGQGAVISQAVDRTAAQRVVVDSLNAVLALPADAATARLLLRVLVVQLRAMGRTVPLTVETSRPPGMRSERTAASSSSPTTCSCYRTGARAPGVGAPSRCLSCAASCTAWAR